MFIGISITEEDVYIKTDIDENILSVPFVMCRTNNATWVIGKSAYAETLNNNGVLIDRFLYLIENDAEITISNYKYTATLLLNNYFKNLLSTYKDIEYLTLSINNNNIKVLNMFQKVLTEQIGNIEKFKIITHEDSLIEYVKKLNIDLLNGTIGLFDFSNKSLMYYEINKTIYKGKVFVNVNKIGHPPVPIEMMSKKSGVIICDNILYKFAQNITKNKKYTCFFLTGEGFLNQDQYRDFINFMCSIGCQVLKEDYLFAIGSFEFGKSVVNDYENTFYAITDSTTKISLTFDAYTNQNIDKIDLIDFGELWFYKICDFDIIAIDNKDLIFTVEFLNGTTKDIVVNINESFKIRKDRTTKLSIRFDFSQQDVLNLLIIDKGFGEFYEPSNKRFNKSYPLV